MFIFYVCPKCGKLFATDESPVCMFCGFDGSCPSLTPSEQQEIEKAHDKWKWDKIYREKYVDHSSPFFDQETFDKREEYEKNYRREIEEEKKESIRRAEEEERKYVPRCPTCGSPRVHRIDKWESMFRKLQFECSKCGYQW